LRCTGPSRTKGKPLSIVTILIVILLVVVILYFARRLF
jgi:hypothetical protein